MPPEPRDTPPGGATLCTLLPFALLLALLAWIHPHTAPHRPAPTPTATATPTTR
ncbi:hypothetical protein ACIRS1_02285 [Kitasatospora sp. NPDC101176]|uniref:hypothetical protein n=1 Tax=Kitasatospora sp. NPDC101176 TaxID=3364099 RepID=UPI0038226175